MPRKKKETTMLVRSVPLDVSERVRRYCRREGIKRREFVERAIGVLEGPNGDNDQGPDHENATDEKVNPMQRVDQITEQVKAYKNAIRLGKEISKIFKELGFLGGRNVQMNAYLELLKIDRGLTEIIEKFIPKHEIPDDIQGRRDMGLPYEYCVDPVPMGEMPKTAMDDFVAGQFQKAEERLKEYMKAAKEMSSEKGSVTDGGLEKPMEEEKPVQPKREPIATRSSQDHPIEQTNSQPNKKGIKTTVFGRGFLGVDEE